MDDDMNLAKELAKTMRIPIEARDGKLYIEKTYHRWNPTGDWSQIGRLIEQYRIALRPEAKGWTAKCGMYLAVDTDPRVAVVKVILAQEG